MIVLISYLQFVETHAIFHSQLISAEGILFSSCFCIVENPDPCRKIACIVVSHIFTLNFYKCRSTFKTYTIARIFSECDQSV